MTASIRTVTPVDDSIYVERAYADEQHIEKTIGAAVEAQRAWRSTDGNAADW